MSASKGLCVRIVTVDYYLCSPRWEAKDQCYSEFRSAAISKVPILRIFGPTLDGRKVCVHVHGVFPYIFVPNWFSEIREHDLYCLASSLDKAINISLGNSSANLQHVFKIEQVMGRPFYGYHVEEKQFLKVFFYNPAMAKRGADLLQNGAVFNRSFQPYESHIPFVLQFFIDNNLYGMSFIKLSDFTIRCDELAMSGTEYRANSQMNNIPKQTYSDIELDATVSDIINKNESAGKVSNNPGLAFIWEEERKRRGKCDLNVTSSLSQPRLNKPTRTEIYYTDKLKEKLSSIDADVDSSIQEIPVVEVPAGEESVSPLINEELIFNMTQSDTLSDELNTQSESVLMLLKKLMSKTSEHPSSTVASSARTTFDYCDEEDSGRVEASQPYLKLFAEDNSILGALPLSDDEGETSDVDEKDHTILSQAFSPLNMCDVDAQEDKNVGQVDNQKDIPQVDGVNDSSDTEFEEHTSKKTRQKSDPELCAETAISCSKKKPQSKGRGCKRTKSKAPTSKNGLSSNTSCDQNMEQSPKRKVSKKSIFKSPSKRVYPQLKISTEKSPVKLYPNTSDTRSGVSKSKTKVAKKASNIEANLSEKSVAGKNQNSVRRRCSNGRIAYLRPKDDDKREPITSKNSAKTSGTTRRERTCSSKVFRKVERRLSIEYTTVVNKSGETVGYKVDILTLIDDSSGMNTVQRNGSSHNSSSTECMVSSLPQLASVFQETSGERKIRTWAFSQKPPTRQEAVDYLIKQEMPLVATMQPFYSNPSDVTCVKDICGKIIKVESRNLDDLLPFKGFTNVMEVYRSCVLKNLCNLDKGTALNPIMVSDKAFVIAPLRRPPTSTDAMMWLKNKKQPAEPENNGRKNVVPKMRVTCCSQESEISADDETECLSVTSVMDQSISQVLGGSNSSGYCKVFRKSLKNDDHVQEDKKEVPVHLNLNSGGTRSSLQLSDQPNEQKAMSRDVSINDSIYETRIQLSNTTRSTMSPSYRIDAATPDNSYNFKMELQNLQDIKDDAQHQHITAMTLELFVKTRGNLRPDPEYDNICCIFYSVLNDAPDVYSIASGIIAWGDIETSLRRDFCRFHTTVSVEKDENSLLNKLVEIVRQWDPDMLIGYEVEMSSWGYLMQRGQYIGRSLDAELSRLKVDTFAQDRLSVIDNGYDVKVIGRILLNTWRLLRHEISLQNYSFESILYHILHQRVPSHTYASLTQWWSHPLYKHIVIDYYLLRTEATLQILQQLDFLGRTSELARLFGIQFYEVLSRGSQFRVESMMLRMTKSQNYVAVSPSIQQRAHMKAPESVQLIMEPESRYYSDPVIVLDFQSLYPSMIIAYNYCFSTCLGRVQYLGRSEFFEFGCIRHFVPVGVLKRLEDHLNISPCGVAFVDKSVRPGILPTMLEEILETRILVKKSMKEQKDNSILQRVLHARQLGLKLIANVTYGYTAANFSGRMPCIEIGDSVVSKGRETLERAIELISKSEKWKAKVVYGDTDSIFVLVPGRTRQEAFEIGQEIADAVTNDNPKPVKLKLEKIYQPCILQTKKRYVGYMYESPDQEKPVYDAKGIETVRRDGCPAVSKILEKSLKLLFETCDVSLVKRFVQRQFSKIISGRVSIQDLIFAREFRGTNKYKPGACVPALQIARSVVRVDRRAEPRVKERVQYVIVAGPPNVPLIKLVRTPEEFFADGGLRINAEYYITRVIVPALDRCFSLLAISTLSWYTELPRIKRSYRFTNGNGTRKWSTVSQYFAVSNCVVCRKVTQSSLCEDCLHKPQATVLELENTRNLLERKTNYLTKICQSCCGRSSPIACANFDCNVLYYRHQSVRDAEQIPYLEDLLQNSW